MTKVTKGLCVAAILICGVAWTGCGSESANNSKQAETAMSKASALPANSWIVPVDVSSATPAQTDWWNLGWQTFVALNWPSAAPSATGVVGLPNTQLSIGASSPNQAMVPTTWLTYRSVANTMLTGASDPGPWANNPVSLPASCSALTSNYSVSPGFTPMLLDMVSKFSSPVAPSNLDEASGPPLISQNGWYVTYDIRLAQSEYTYIQQNGYYNGNTQSTAEKTNGKLLPFPRDGQGFTPALPALAQFGALEVKAAWRVLDPVADKAIIPRYYTQTGYFLQQDGTTCQGPALFGLVGMHILRLTPTTPSTWFWATFEQVDNVVPPPSGGSATLAAANTPNGACTSQYNVAPATPTGNIPWNGSNTAVNVCMATNVASGVAQVNQTWQTNLSGTVWANYQLIDTINPSVSGGPTNPIPISNTNVNTNILANTTMETYLQGSGPGNGQSCMDCHAFATPQGTATKNATNQIFTFVLGNADSPATLAATRAGGRRRGRLPQNVLDIIHGKRKGQSKSK